ncbi:MAG: hypothetical protein ACRDV6_00815 [Acidimicrobiales bacterium]
MAPGTVTNEKSTPFDVRTGLERTIVVGAATNCPAAQSGAHWFVLSVPYPRAEVAVHEAHLIWATYWFASAQARMNVEGFNAGLMTPGHAMTLGRVAAAVALWGRHT